MYINGRNSQVIMGVSPGLFKMNKTGSSHRKRSKVAVLHTGDTVKPIISTITGLFTLLTPMPSIQAGGFLYQQPGGYLTIVNTSDIEITLVVDPVGHGYVTTTPQASDKHAALVTSNFF